MQTPLDPAASDGPPEGATGAEAWLLVCDALMRGLNHALSNRVATVSAVVSVIVPDAEGADAEMFKALLAEVRRLEKMLRLLRLVPSTPHPATDAVRAAEILAHVVEAHEHHPDLREVPCTLECGTGLPAVPIRESALAHAALALITAAKQVVCDHGGGEVRVRCGGDARGLALRVEALPGTPLPGAEYRLPPLVPISPAVAVRAARWAIAGERCELRETAAEGALAGYELAVPAPGPPGPR